MKIRNKEYPFFQLFTNLKLISTYFIPCISLASLVGIFIACLTSTKIIFPERLVVKEISFYYLAAVLFVSLVGYVMCCYMVWIKKFYELNLEFQERLSHLGDKPSSINNGSLYGFDLKERCLKICKKYCYQFYRYLLLWAIIIFSYALRDFFSLLHSSIISIWILFFFCIYTIAIVIVIELPTLLVLIICKRSEYKADFKIRVGS